METLNASNLLFADNKVKIFTDSIDNNLYVIARNEILANVITSKKVRYLPGLILAIVGLLLFVPGYIYDSAEPIMIGSVLIIMSFTWFLWIMGTKYTIELTTHKGKINFISSLEKEYIDKVFSFLEQKQE